MDNLDGYITMFAISFFFGSLWGGLVVAIVIRQVARKVLAKED